MKSLLFLVLLYTAVIVAQAQDSLLSDSEELDTFGSRNPFIQALPPLPSRRSGVLSPNDLSKCITQNELHGQGSAPPKREAEALNNAACQCSKILISSLGEAQHIQPDSMGVYKYYQMYGGRPSYYGPNNRRLYYNGQSAGWLLGATLGANVGFLYNHSQYTCPYLVNGGWMYVNHGYWYKDESLVVRCVA